MKNGPASPREIKLAKLFATHAAVKKLLKEALKPNMAEPEIAKFSCQSDFDPRHLKTPDAETGRHSTIALTLSEAHTLLRYAIPPASRTIPARTEHALLMIAIASFLDELAAIDSPLIPWEAIAASQHLAVQLRDWIVLHNQVVMQPSDKMSNSMAGRPRLADAGRRVPAGTVDPGTPFASWPGRRRRPRDAENPANQAHLPTAASWHNQASAESKNDDLLPFPKNVISKAVRNGQ
jgi:hypothetical protein